MQTATVLLRSFPDLCVADVESSKEFYRELLAMDVVVDHGWYVELGIGTTVMLALVDVDHETVPVDAHGAPHGVLVTFQVDDVEHCRASAVRLGCPTVLETVSELGQRHFMVADPDGAVIDVIELVPLTRRDLRRLAGYRRERAGRIEDPCR